MSPQTNENETPLTVLQRARAFIKLGWCKNMLAKDADGCGLASNDPKAVQWCALGAVGAAIDVTHPWNTRLGSACVTTLSRQVPVLGYGIVDFNNNSRTSKKDMLEVFDRAILSQRGYGFAAFRAATLSALKETP